MLFGPSTVVIKGREQREGMTGNGRVMGGKNYKKENNEKRSEREDEIKEHGGREEIMTSYSATNSGLCFCTIALQQTHRILKTNQTHPNQYAHFTYCGRKKEAITSSLAFYLKSSFAFENETGKGRGRTEPCKQKNKLKEFKTNRL